MDASDCGHAGSISALRILAAANAAFTGATTRSQALDRGLETVCRGFGFDLALAWLVDESEQHLVMRGCWGAAGSESLCEELTSLRRQFGQTCVGAAWASGQLCEARESEDEVARYAGLNYRVAIPCESEGVRVGVIELASSRQIVLTDVQRDTLLTVVREMSECMQLLEWRTRARELQKALADREREVEQAQDKLEQTIERLRLIEQQSNELNKFKTQFVADISMQLRNPMSGILAGSELLQKTRLDERQQEYIDLVHDSADVLMHLFNDLLRVYELDATPIGTSQRRTRRTRRARDLKSLRILVVHGLIGLGETVAANAVSLGLQCRTTSRGAAAIDAIKQAHTAGQPFDLVLSEIVLPDMTAYEMARLIQLDKDSAAPELLLITTFQSAEQTERALRAGFAGTVSRPFTQSRLLATISALFGLEASIESAGVSNTGIPLILVADDNLVNQKVAALQLHEMGFQAHLVSNGAEAVEAYKKVAYDAILMDCQMPVMDGFAATEVIRGHEQSTGKHVPVIAMTAYALVEDKQRCLNAGMDDFISKPVRSEQLESVLSRWIQMEEKALNFSPEPDANLIDIGPLQESLGEDYTRDILGVFIETTPPLLDRIEAAAVQHDGYGLKEAAHELKGACASIGANLMAATCKQIELAALDGDWDEVPDLTYNLQNTYEQTKTYISQNLL